MLSVAAVAAAAAASSVCVPAGSGGCERRGEGKARREERRGDERRGEERTVTGAR
jgi:hypothetical protein